MFLVRLSSALYPVIAQLEHAAGFVRDEWTSLSGEARLLQRRDQRNSDRGRRIECGTPFSYAEIGL
jgi:hypothetical protein